MFSPVVRVILMIVAIAIIILCALIIFGVITNPWIQTACYSGAAILMIMLMVETKKGKIKRHLIIIFVCLFGYGANSYAQDVRPEFSVNIHEFTDNEGRPHYTWTLGRLTWADYDQQESWKENPNMRLNIYLMPVGVMWHQGSSCGPSLMADIGTRFTRHIYSGIETGVNFINGYYSLNTYVPLALNVKGLLPVGTRFCPYIQASAGGYFGIQNLKGTNGFYSSLKAGIEYNRINLTAGYSFIKLPAGFIGNLQIHFGLRIGQ